MSGHGHFSCYEGHKKRRTGEIRGDFFKNAQGFGRLMLARAPALPAQDLHHHGPRCFICPCFCIICGLEELDKSVIICRVCS